MSSIAKINDSQLEALVIKQKKSALVLFGAVWSGACSVAKSVLEQIAPSYEGKLNFYTVDADANAQSAMKYGVNSVPTVLIFKSGEVGGRIAGVFSQAKLQEIIGKT
jgi:thioredoxin 1